MSPVKISKRQIKEDKLVTFIFKATEYIQKNQQRILIIGGSALALILIGYIFLSSKAGSQKQAADLFGKAFIEIQSGSTQVGLLDLRNVVERYGGTESASWACYYLANLYYEQKDYNQAKIYYQRYVDKYKNDPLLTSSSLAGIGACSNQAQNYQEAAKFYLEAASSAADYDFLAPEYLIETARALKKSGQIEKAKETYQKLLNKYPQSTYTFSAKRELAELG